MKESPKIRSMVKELRERAQKSMEILDRDINRYNSIYNEMTSLYNSLESRVWGTVPLDDFKKYHLPFVESRIGKSKDPFETKMIIREAIDFYKGLQRKNYN